MPVDWIAEVLWAGDPPAEPAQHVATLVSRLRRVLGPEAIQGGRQGYQLAGSPAITVDLDEAARLTGQAERELGRAPADCCAGPGTPWPGLRRRLRTFHSVLTFLRALAARTPVLLMVDDLQYAGQSTIEFVHYLGRHLGGTRMLTMATVLRALAEGDSGLPETLRSAVQARVRRLGATAEQLLRMAAVLGATVGPVTVAGMADMLPAAALNQCELALRAATM